MNLNRMRRQSFFALGVNEGEDKRIIEGFSALFNTQKLCRSLNLHASFKRKRAFVKASEKAFKKVLEKTFWEVPWYFFILKKAF